MLPPGQSLSPSFSLFLLPPDSLILSRNPFTLSHSFPLGSINTLSFVSVSRLRRSSMREMRVRDHPTFTLHQLSLFSCCSFIPQALSLCLFTFSCKMLLFFDILSHHSLLLFLFSSSSFPFSRSPPLFTRMRSNNNDNTCFAENELFSIFFSTQADTC